MSGVERDVDDSDDCCWGWTVVVMGTVMRVQGVDSDVGDSDDSCPGLTLIMVVGGVQL